jgi:hypothetical protein
MTSRILENAHPDFGSRGRHFKSQPVVGNSKPTVSRYFPAIGFPSFLFSLALALQRLALLMKVLHYAHSQDEMNEVQV